MRAGKEERRGEKEGMGGACPTNKKSFPRPLQRTLKKSLFVISKKNASKCLRTELSGLISSIKTVHKLSNSIKILIMSYRQNTATC